MYHGPVSSEIYREFITDYLNEERQIRIICLTIRMCEEKYRQFVNRGHHIIGVICRH